MSRTWFISDTHFGHANIIGFCNRPFASVEEMDAVMIVRWNETVAYGDTVYHLGDLCLGGIEEAAGYLRRLNGQIHILQGNHDGRWWSYLSGYRSAGLGRVTRCLPIEMLSLPAYSRDGVHPRTLVLCHYPLASWESKTHGAWHLYGHVHNNPEPDGRPLPSLGLALNVSVELTDYRPLSLEQVASRLITKELEDNDE